MVFEKMRRMNDVLFTAIFLTMALSITYATGELSKIIVNQSINKGFSPFKSTMEEFITVILIAPVLETFLFQYLPFKLTRKWMSPVLSILLCGVIFSALHTYNWFYMLSAGIVGLLLGTAYYLKIDSGRAFIIVTAIHLFNNSVVFAISHI